MYNKEIPGQISTADLKALEFLAQTVPKYGIIIELGSLFGKSSWCLAKSCDPTVTVHCVDNWQYIIHSKQKNLNGKEITKELHIEYTNDCHNIVRHKTQIQNFTKQWSGGRVDLIFIDAIHELKNDFKNCLREWKNRSLKSHGIISGHDYNGEFPEKDIWIEELAEEFSQQIITFNLNSSPPRSSTPEESSLMWYFKNVLL
jgi:predicted O-methyltransferase YrrM